MEQKWLNQDPKPGNLVLDSMFLTPLLTLLLSVRDPDMFMGLKVAQSGRSEYWGKAGNKFRKVAEGFQMTCSIVYCHLVGDGSPSQDL